MNKLIKFSINVFFSGKVFEYKFLRNIRWFMYRRLYQNKNLFVGSSVTIKTAHYNKKAYFNTSGILHIGDGAYIDYSGGINIYTNVAISEFSSIYTHDHLIHGKHKNWMKNGIKFYPLTIEKNAWIGSNSVILPSVETIGEGAIIAAGAVLTKNAEPYGIYAGNPARLIKKRLINNA